ncbi:MAG: tetratricopeptide repeat protein, partial [Muribaculaceae bacterium]|nr:tetratricopeptide repeat protein [Muribaculaceae bacterium]
MKLYLYLKFLLVLIAFSLISSAGAQSLRAERKLIMEGNRLYVERKFKDAAVKYEEALAANPESAVAKYNLGMSRIRQVANPKDTSTYNSKLLDEGTRRLSEVASMAREKPGLASKANYNLGNLSFNREDFASAISFYKEALRIDPKDMNARKNLRIAQLKQQQNQNQQNQDQKRDQQKEKNISQQTAN